MSSVVGSVLGLAGGAGGTGFQGPQSANIVNPVTQKQIDQSYDQNQAALQKQQDLLAALQGQNGLGNQSQVFNQMQGVANGTGPNPAQAQLAQATGANVANQAAMAAGQRGASANVGMMQRQAGQQGAGIQQQANGQAASLQAQQSLGALNQMGGMANQMAANQVGQTNANTQAAQANQQTMLNAQQGYNQSQVSNQAGMNTANAALAQTRMGQQGQFVGGLMQGFGIGTAAPAAAAAARGGMVQQYAEGDMVQPIAQQDPFGPSKFGQFVSKALAGDGRQDPQQSLAPLPLDPQLQKGASALGKGIGQNMRGGPQPQAVPQQVAGGPMDAGGPMPDLGTTSFGPMDSGGNVLGNGLEFAASGGMMGQLAQLAPMIAMMAAQGGKVPAMVSPGEKYLSPKDVEKVAKQDKNPMSVGKEIPGKPKVGGAKNSYANDTVPATLDAGGIVIPRSVTQAKDPGAKAKAFVEAVLAKKGQSLPRKAK